MKTLYVKVCNECGRKFETESDRDKLCPRCFAINKSISKEDSRRREKVKKEKKRRMNTYNVMPIDKFMNYLNLYNKKHRTEFTYGQMQAALNNGKVKKEDFYL